MANPVPISRWTVDSFVEQRVLPYLYKVRAVFIHHVYAAASTFRGLESMHEVQMDWHIRGRGWSAIGANAYTTPDGAVYNGRPLSWGNWAHCVVKRPWGDLPEALVQLMGYDEVWPNHHGVGIETWGNFDAEDPTTSVAMRTTIKLAARICEVADLDPYLHVWPHGCPAATDPALWGPAYKSCPGDRVDMQWVRDEIAREMGLTPARTPRGVIVDPATEFGHVIEGIEHNGRLLVPFRDVMEYLGFCVNAQPWAEQRKVYARALPQAVGRVRRLLWASEGDTNG